VFDYFRELVRQGEDKKLKIGLFWTVFDMMHSSIWKLEYSRDMANDTVESFNNIFLETVEKLKQNMTDDDFGWIGVYGDETKR
jgi:hypothetical protein